MNQSELQHKIDKALERKGIVLNDPEVLEAMEHTESGMRFLPLRVTKSSGISGDALVSAERLGRLRAHTEAILGQICREIAAGNIDADPYWRDEEKNACRYCPFLRACQFEEDRDQRRVLNKLSNDEFWHLLESDETTQKGGESHGNSANA